MYLESTEVHGDESNKHGRGGGGESCSCRWICRPESLGASSRGHGEHELEIFKIKRLLEASPAHRGVRANPATSRSGMVLTVLRLLPPDPATARPARRRPRADRRRERLVPPRVINRNNCLRRLLSERAPDIIVRNEKRMLQEAVDAPRQLPPQAGRLRAPMWPTKLKSPARQDQGQAGPVPPGTCSASADAGCSVIVGGPTLRLHQCGSSKKMALELFKLFIFSKLQLRGEVSIISAAKRLAEREGPEAWDILEEVIREHPVLLNRKRRRLYRLGIQAFEPCGADRSAARFSCIRWSAPRSTPISTATRWPFTCPCPSRHSSRPGR